MDPEVDPAIPPTNINPRIRIPSAGAHNPKSTVPNPVVVTIVSDVKTAFLIVSATGPPQVPIAIRSAATRTIPR